MVTCIEKFLLPSLSSSPPDVEAMRVYLTLPFCHVFHQPQYYKTHLCQLASAIASLETVPSKVLGKISKKNY